MSNCSLTLQKEKLPKIISKLEYMMFRAMEAENMDVFEMTGENKRNNILKLLNTVRDKILPETIASYEAASKQKESEGDTASAEMYSVAAANLEAMRTMWPQIFPNFLKFSTVFEVRNKFVVGEDGLVDLTESGDSEAAMKKLVFDQPSNEIDPIDDVDKAVELFIRSLPDEDTFDDYGFTSSINYSNFVRQLFTDVENSTSLDEIVRKMQNKVSAVPAYQKIIDKLKHQPGQSSQETRFRINFRNSFMKAFIPIYMVSLEEGGTIKTFEAATGKKSGYERKIQSNFYRTGMPVMLDGKEINLAHEVNGAWQLDATDLPKIQEYLENAPGPELRARQVAFLKALGFEFSPKTEEALLKSAMLGDGSRSAFNYLKNHVVAILKNLKPGEFVNNPILRIKRDITVWDSEEKKARVVSEGQNNFITKLIDGELKYNTVYNMDRNMITAEGNRMHAIQLHNNFTILNKYFSDPVAYPTLQDILKEPSMAWMNPETNVSIRNSMFFNSLFYFDPSGEHYGKRKRVDKDANNKLMFSPDKGEYVQLKLVNTGGLQTRFDDETKGAGSTDLNEIDKLLQDINAFRQAGYNSVLRLGDKSTDLGLSLNYYNDPTTPVPQKNPLSFSKNSNEQIFTTQSFLQPVMGHLQDVVELRYLGANGFMEELSFASKNIKDTWGYFQDILNKELKDEIDEMIANASSMDELDLTAMQPKLEKRIVEYFEANAKDFLKKFDQVYKMAPNSLMKLNYKVETFQGAIKYYLANAFLLDLDQMKTFFGDSIFFKDFHKRAPKDSATGVFTTVDENVLADLNDTENKQGYGANTNLAGRNLIERLFATGQITEAQRTQALNRQVLTHSFRSAVMQDVNFKSIYADRILENVEKLKANNLVTPAMQKLFDKDLKDVISKKYNGTEADGQGKATFDFYRIMSILTSQWSSEQENVYRKIVEFNHYDELAESEKDDKKRVEYIRKRDAVGYDPLEEVYFPPKKFQYAGPMGYQKTLNDGTFNMYVPVFDKFSLQPLIPTMIKGTADEQLAKRMEFNGVGYLKFESGSKLETPKNKDSYYVDFDGNNPENRSVKPFAPTDKFSGEQELYFNHLKEQVNIDAEIHESSTFGSQIRKLIMMNMELPEFEKHYQDYTTYIAELVEIEKARLYSDLGIRRDGQKLKVGDMNKLIEYFLKEISKKNQSSNVRRVLNYDEATGKFTVPLDGAVQAQVIEGIILSAINNKIVRYKANGSMLVQVAITGSERIKFNKDASKKALETFGNTELKYYDIVEEDGKLVTSAMQVKIAMTGKWTRLLSLPHRDGRPIETLPRMNEMLKDEAWKKENREQIRMVAYRIPTQGRNFSDVMEVAEFLPAQFGDAIIMPSEVVIKSGSDFDIDKMFVFYPNLNYDGTLMRSDYTKEELSNPNYYEELKAVVQNRLFKTMSDVILHPANYIELVTPSENFHLMPIVDEIYKKVYSQGRTKTDYKHSEILDRAKNIRKYLSLLKGKSDLGIAAIANTFNILFQHADAKTRAAFFEKNALSTNFTSPFITFKEGTKVPETIDLSSIYDEDGVLKSEFYSEFINAFVDVAKDDYVFAVNVVTELSPIMFYMKYTGLSTPKIMYMMNQPIIREFIRKMMTYQNKFVQDKLGNESARKRAIKEIAYSLGFPASEPYTRKALNAYVFSELKKEGISNNTLRKYYTEENLLKQIQPDGQDLRKMKRAQQLIQLSYLGEMENLKVQADSMTEAQRALNFDTNDYGSSFDVYARNQAYKDAEAMNVLTPETLQNIKKNSIISSLDVANDIAQLQSELFPVRNDIAFNKYLLNVVTGLKNNFENQAIRTQDDMLKFARTAKNDLINYILQNHFEKSEEGKAFFKKEFGTDQPLNEYLRSLVQTNTMVDQFNAIKKLDYYNDLVEQFPMVNNLIFERSEKNPRLFTFKMIENSANPIEKESVIAQFELLANLESEEYKPVRDFFRNLALYSVFQSGLNTSSNSYSDIVPVDLINPLYGYAVEEFKKLDKLREYEKFYSQFIRNNPTFYGYNAMSTPVKDVSSRGKWYSTETPLEWSVAKPKQVPAQPSSAPAGEKVVAVVPQNKISGVESFGSLVMGNATVQDALGPNAHSIDMIEQGLRTRTTRSAKEMAKYNVKVGDIIAHKGLSADGQTKTIMSRVTAIHPKGTPGFKETWEKEGWRAEDVSVVDRFAQGAAAIEFELLVPLESAQTTSKPAKAINHSGGATGADSIWGAKGKPYGVESKHYYLTNKTPEGNVDIAGTEAAKEGPRKVAQAAKVMWGYNYAAMKDERLIRNWAQVVNSDAVYAIAPIGKEGDVWSEDRGKKDPRTIKKSEAVQGGTGYAVEMAIQAGKTVYVYNDPNAKASSHLTKGWYTWNGTQYVAVETPVLTANFAGIGSRNISKEAEQAIEEVYKKTFGEIKAVQPAVKQPTAKPLSTQGQPLQIYSDGSDIKGTGKIGFGAVFEYNGQMFDLSGTNESKEVQRLQELHPDAKFSNPTMEMMALVSVLSHFKNSREHIVINQDYVGAVNYGKLWDRSAGSDQRAAKPWKSKEAYIKTLVEAAEKLIDKIESNGGSVQIRWVKGHSGNRLNDLADQAAKSREIFNNFGKAQAVTTPSSPQEIISQFFQENNITPTNTPAEMQSAYAKERLQDESLLEFLQRKFCKGN